MARDPQRIDKILQTIRTVWEKNPQLRLTQLLGNCFEGGHGDLYYVEDHELYTKIKENYKGCFPQSQFSVSSS